MDSELPTPSELEIKKNPTTKEFLIQLRQELKMPYVVFAELYNQKSKDINGNPRDLDQERPDASHRQDIHSGALDKMELRVDVERTGLVTEDAHIIQLNKTLENEVSSALSKVEDSNSMQEGINSIMPTLTGEYQAKLRVAIVELSEQGKLTLDAIKVIVAETVIYSSASQSAIVSGDGEQTKESNDYGGRIALSLGLELGGIAFVNEKAFSELGRSLMTVSVLTGSPTYFEQVSDFEGQQIDNNLNPGEQIAISKQYYEDKIRSRLVEMYGNDKDLDYMQENGISIETAVRGKDGDEFTHFLFKTKRDASEVLQPLTSEDMEAAKRLLRAASHTEFAHYLPSDLEDKKASIKNVFGRLANVDDQDFPLWFGVRYGAQRLDDTLKAKVDQQTKNYKDSEKLLKTYTKKSSAGAEIDMAKAKKNEHLSYAYKAIVDRDPNAQFYINNVLQQRRSEALDLRAFVETLDELNKSDVEVTPEYYQDEILPKIKLDKARRASDRV